MVSVLWVDDNKRAGRGTAKRLERSNKALSVTAVYSVAEAREHLERSEVDVVVSGHELPDGDSFEVFRAAGELRPDAVPVLYSESPANEAAAGINYRYIDRSREDAIDELERSVLRAQGRKPDVNDLDFSWSPIQEALDRVAEIAAVTLEAKAAFLAHKRDGEAVIASYGFDPDDISGADTVCHPYHENEVVTVTDVRSDPRFSGSFYSHFGIRSYMAAPVESSLEALLCVVDDRRRKFNPEETYLLQTIAAEANDQLVLREKYVEATERSNPPRMDTNH